MPFNVGTAAPLFPLGIRMAFLTSKLINDALLLRNVRVQLCGSLKPVPHLFEHIFWLLYRWRGWLARWSLCRHFLQHGAKTEWAGKGMRLSEHSARSALLI